MLSFSCQNTERLCIRLDIDRVVKVLPAHMPSKASKETTADMWKVNSMKSSALVRCTELAEEQ